LSAHTEAHGGYGSGVGSDLAARLISDLVKRFSRRRSDEAGANAMINPGEPVDGDLSERRHLCVLLGRHRPGEYDRRVPWSSYVRSAADPCAIETRRPPMKR